MAAAVAKHVGARHVVITDVNEYRLELARKMGVTRAVNVAKESLTDVMAELGMTEGFDVGLEMSGAPPAFRTMLDTMNHGGRIAMLGIPRRICLSTGIKSSSRACLLKVFMAVRCLKHWYKMAALIQSGLDLSPIITHRFSIDDFQQGFDAMRSGAFRQGYPELELTKQKERWQAPFLQLSSHSPIFISFNRTISLPVYLKAINLLSNGLTLMCGLPYVQSIGMPADIQFSATITGSVTAAHYCGG